MDDKHAFTRTPQAANAAARFAAIKRLQDAHLDEWNKIYAEERKKRGLTAARSISALQEENRFLRMRLAELEDAT